MDQIAKASPAERAQLFLRSAEAMKPRRLPAIIEKDFWVCWALHRIFGLQPLSPHLIFKGGTSLSKVYNAIERFSEDVDISIGREYVGSDDPKEPGISNTKSKKRVDRLVEMCKVVIESKVLPQLRADFASVLGETGWAIGVDVKNRDVLVFSYPREEGRFVPATGILPSIRLEMGARTDPWPEEQREIRPYAAEAVPEVFSTPSVRVRVLDARRTFWEKVTILHAQASGDKLRPNYSRHYYDVYQLCRQEIGREARDRTDIFLRVVEHKQLFFPSSSAGYDAAVPGSLQLIPGQNRDKELRADYDRMKEMIFGTVPSWEEILEGLKTLQAEINAKKQ